MFIESSQLLLDWLHDTHMDSTLIHLIGEYLLERGSVTMTDLCQLYPQFLQVAADIDTLGWDCLLEGRIPCSLVHLQIEYLRRAQSYWKIRTWASHLIQHLLNITHRQWLYRNARIHLRKLEGMTTSEHLAVIDLVKDMMLVDPSDLLPQHRRLLELDYKALGEGSSVDRKLWLERMRSALSAAEVVNSRTQRHRGRRRQRSETTEIAIDRYAIYREQAGIAATKRSNIAKKARL